MTLPNLRGGVVAGVQVAMTGRATPMIDDKRLAAIRAHIASGRYPACYAPELLAHIDALAARLEAAEAKASAVSKAWDAVMATEPDMWSVKGHPVMRATVGLDAFRGLMAAMRAYRLEIAAPHPAAEEVAE